MPRPGGAKPAKLVLILDSEGNHRSHMRVCAPCLRAFRRWFKTIFETANCGRAIFGLALVPVPSQLFGFFDPVSASCRVPETTAEFAHKWAST